MSTPPKEHEIQNYLQVKKRLAYLSRKGAYEVITKPTALSSALNKLTTIPAVTFNLANYHNKIKLGLAYRDDEEPQDAGKLEKPDLAALLTRSTPSPFGRGDQTVLDPTYRHGREIVAVNICMDDDHNDDIKMFLKKKLAATLFNGQRVKVVLYKMVIYEVGGHFDWHRDSTHSDAHHGTVLVALDTEWEGGDLLLRRSADGKEMRVDLHPDRGVHTGLKAVAFFTDTEHRVEPVTSGARVVLQYDVEVQEAKDRDEWWDDIILEKVHGRFREHARRRAAFDEVYPSTNAAVEEVVAAIHSLLDSGENIVTFPLQHLYRLASIRPAFLKGVDQLLYHALADSGDFLVELHAVVLSELKDCDHRERINMYIFDGLEENAPNKDDLSNCEPDPPQGYYGYTPGQLGSFYLNSVPALQEISKQDYIDYTGNESQPACYRYFGGGMFVRRNLNLEK